MKLLTGFLVGAPVWLATGVYIGLRLVWAEEPKTTYADAARTSDDWDEADDMCPNCVTPWKCNGPHEPTYATGGPVTGSWAPANETGCEYVYDDDWATDPYTTALTEAHA